MKNKYVDAIMHAVAQHVVCSIARDASSRYPNPNRVGRNAMNAIENITTLETMGEGGGGLNDLSKLLNKQPKNNEDLVLNAIKSIEARLTKANL